MKIGFIGLGVMGNRMAKNIIKNGHELLVFDMNPVSVKDLESCGAQVAKSSFEVAQSCSVICCSLPNAAIVEAVILGENGVLAGCKEGSVIIDLSSITPKTIQKISEKAKKKNVTVVDAPVSGGAAGAEKGTLTIMVGGEKEIVEKVMPVLECMGKKINHVGGVGAGDTVKLVNNLLLGTNMVAVAEALSLGTKAGIDPDILYDIISQSSGGSYALTAKYENFISQGNFEPGFMIDLQFKDLQLAVSTAKDLKQPLMLGNVAQQLYEMARAKGLGQKDISAVINIYEELAGVKVRKEK